MMERRLAASDAKLHEIMSSNASGSPTVTPTVEGGKKKRRTPSSSSSSLKSGKKKRRRRSASGSGGGSDSDDSSSSCSSSSSASSSSRDSRKKSKKRRMKKEKRRRSLSRTRALLDPDIIASNLKRVTLPAGVSKEAWGCVVTLASEYEKRIRAVYLHLFKFPSQHEVESWWLNKLLSVGGLTDTERDNPLRRVLEEWVSKVHRRILK